jgi:putative ABC transport system permease protein
MKELLIEVFAAMKGNRMRIALTGFSIGWGIFILIVLISSGRGLINGMYYNFREYNVGVVTVTPGLTSQPFEGRSQGRTVHLYEEDAAALQQLLGDTVTKAIPVVSHAVQASCGEEYVNTVVDGYAPGYAIAPNILIVAGRDINDLDMMQQRKVCVIPKVLKNMFFRNDTTVAVGQKLLLNGISFQIIGVYEPVLSINTTRAIVAPLSTVKRIWRPDGELSRLFLQTALLTTTDLNRQFNAHVIGHLAARKDFAPTDKKAIKIDNLYERPVLISNIMDVLTIFVAIVGLATLMSGMVGVSNIMLISVKERTREMGIRRAVGAKTRHIVALVLAESVVISVIFGYVGMMVGVGLMELMAWISEKTGNIDTFSDPTIEVSHAVEITLIMVVVGLIAGYVPAKQAAGIRLTVAMEPGGSQTRRRLMTAFGVFWGILLLTLLVGSGTGLDNGIAGKVKSLSPNEAFIHVQETSIPYRGFGRGRKWLLNSHDEELIRGRFGQMVKAYSPVNYAGYQNVVRDDQSHPFMVSGVDPQFVSLIPQRVTTGRFINDIDMLEHRKVCVIGEHVAEVLFNSPEEAIGSNISVNGMALTVVGITHCTNRHILIGIDLSESVLMPLPTEQTAYGRGDEIDYCSITMDDAFPMEQQKGQIVALIKENHFIHPDDELAITAPTVSEECAMYNNAITGVNILIWIVGLGTLMAGLIGITNIMLVSVRERTREIGIRRAVGATPRHIIKEIMLESLVLTLGAGLLGLCVGVWLLHGVDNMLPQGDDTVISRLHMPFWKAIISLLILVAGGLLAGWIPARRAIAIKPIEALREE